MVQINIKNDNTDPGVMSATFTNWEGRGTDPAEWTQPQPEALLGRTPRGPSCVRSMPTDIHVKSCIDRMCKRGT